MAEQQALIHSWRQTELQKKGSFPYVWFDRPDKLQNTELPPYDVFYSKLRSSNPLEAEHTDYVDLLKSGLTTEQGLVKLKRSKPLGLRILETCNSMEAGTNELIQKLFALV